MTANCYFYCYDGNGNVINLIDIDTKEIAAHYEYDPFGRLLEKEGSFADRNFYRFSTKRVSAVFGLYYYGWRFYDPDLARWLTRDPIGEKGGLNLYGFVGNNPVAKYDILGLRGGGSSKGKCCKCGPNIEQGLIKTMLAVNKRFNNDDKFKKKICSKLHLKNVWDIYFPPKPKGCGDGDPCYETFMVRGKCYDQWKINYILFGRISKLCEFWKPTMEVMVAAHKLLIKPFIQIKQNEKFENEYTSDVKGWARIGYNFNGSLPSGLPKSTGGYNKKCKKCDKSDSKYNKAFSIRW